MTNIPIDIINDKSIKTYIVYDNKNCPISAYQRIDNSNEFTDVLSLYLSKYNHKLELERQKAEEIKNKRKETLIRNKTINDNLSKMTREEQISYLQERLDSLNRIKGV